MSSLRRRLAKLSQLAINPSAVVAAQQRWKHEGTLPGNRRLASTVLGIAATVLAMQGRTDVSGELDDEQHQQAIDGLHALAAAVEAGRNVDEDRLNRCWRSTAGSSGHERNRNPST